MIPRGLSLRDTLMHICLREPCGLFLVVDLQVNFCKQCRMIELLFSAIRKCLAIPYRPLRTLLQRIQCGAWCVSPRWRREGRRSKRSHRGVVVSCVIKINGGAAVWMEPLGPGPGGCTALLYYLNSSHFRGSFSRVQQLQRDQLIIFFLLLLF